MKTILFIISISAACIACKKNKTEITEGEWEVVSAMPNGTSTIIAAPDSYILNLEQNKFSLNLDVNSASGKIQVFKKGEIKFDNEITITQACCDSEFADNLLGQLTGMTQYKIENSELIFSGNGEITLKRK